MERTHNGTDLAYILKGTKKKIKRREIITVRAPTPGQLA